MALTTQQRIRLQELLLQREALYARVHAIETQIHRTFGAEYPLPPPPVEVAAPGAQNQKKKNPPRKTSPPKIRPLADEETAYRIRFHEASATADEIHIDHKAIERLLQSPLAEEWIATIETLRADGKVAQRLFP